MPAPLRINLAARARIRKVNELLVLPGEAMDKFHPAFGPERTVHEAARDALRTAHEIIAEIFDQSFPPSSHPEELADDIDPNEHAME